MTDAAAVSANVATLTDILPAIAAAMGDVEKVAKGDRNKHDGYNFASIDNFLSLVNPICARHGLVIFSDELSREDFTRKGRNGDAPWMRISFSFTVHHVTGQSLPPMTRSVEVMRNGAQAYGSAQSYCLKQFLRGLFLIPTGDKDDADFERKDDGEIVQHPARRNPQGPSRDSIFMAIDCLQSAETTDDLRDVWNSLDRPTQALAEVINAKDARKAELVHAKNDFSAIAGGHDGAGRDGISGAEIPY